MGIKFEPAPAAIERAVQDKLHRLAGQGHFRSAALAGVQPHVPVAVITAYGSAESAVAALKAGAFDYLTKPLGLDALRTLVRSALQIGRAHV